MCNFVIQHIIEHYIFCRNSSSQNSCNSFSLLVV